MGSDSNQTKAAGLSLPAHGTPAGEGPLPFVRLDFRGLEPEAQTRMWQASAPRAYAVGSGGRDRGALDIATSAWRVDSLLLTRFRSRAHLVLRPRQLLREKPAPFVKLRLYLAGGTRLFDGEGAALGRLGSEAVHVFDHSRAWIADHEDLEHISLFLPHALIGYDPARHPICTSLPLSEPVGRVLGDAFGSFARQVSVAQAGDAAALAAGIAGLVRGLLEGGVTSETEPDVRAARRTAMCRYLERNLRDTALGVESLCSAFGAARSTIYRDFAEHGGVERYILRQRLARAFDDLSHARDGRGAVREAAERWGFASVSHFSHAFTQHFGMRPSSAIGIAVPPEAPPAADPPEPGHTGLEQALARLARLYARFHV